jgi:hypothetical protein
MHHHFKDAAIQAIWEDIWASQRRADICKAIEVEAAMGALHVELALKAAKAGNEAQMDTMTAASTESWNNLGELTVEFMATFKGSK